MLVNSLPLLNSPRVEKTQRKEGRRRGAKDLKVSVVVERVPNAAIV